MSRGRRRAARLLWVVAGCTALGAGSVPPRRVREPKVWGELAVEGEAVVARLRSWRMVVAFKRKVSVPLSSVVGVRRDPEVRAHVRAKLRMRASRSGMMRLGVYHSMDGWSFWAVGLARNAVVVETSGTRFRFVVVEVADPLAKVEELNRAVAEYRAAHPGEGEEPPEAGRERSAGAG